VEECSGGVQWRIAVEECNVQRACARAQGGQQHDFAIPVFANWLLGAGRKSGLVGAFSVTQQVFKMATLFVAVVYSWLV
jgi:hypothetical protein